MNQPFVLKYGDIFNRSKWKEHECFWYKNWINRIYSSTIFCWAVGNIVAFSRVQNVKNKNILFYFDKMHF